MLRRILRDSLNKLIRVPNTIFAIATFLYSYSPRCRTFQRRSQQLVVSREIAQTCQQLRRKQPSRGDVEIIRTISRRMQYSTFDHRIGDIRFIIGT